MLNDLSLKKIRNAEFEENTSNGAKLKQIQTLIGQKTNNFLDPSGISDVKIDMTDDIKAAGKSVESYKQKFGSVMRSGLDVCEHLIQIIDGKETKEPETTTTPTTTTDADKAKAKRKRRIAIKLKLQLQLSEN